MNLAQTTNVVEASSSLIRLLLLLLLFFDPVLNSQGIKKLRYAIQRSTKIKLE